MKAALILLSMVFFLLISTGAKASVSTFLAPERAGSYSLVQGTDGCPGELIWESQATCKNGFHLQEVKHSQKPLTHSENFCDINKETPTQVKRVRGHEKFNIEYDVKADDLTLTKTQRIEHSINNASYTVHLQASLILSHDGSFMYDRSLGNKGWSCLYKK